MRLLRMTRGRLRMSLHFEEPEEEYLAWLEALYGWDDTPGTPPPDTEPG